MMTQSPKNIFYKFESIASILGCLGVCTILLAAIYVQYFDNEPPCALCLLQRAGFVSVGLALLMNLRYGNRVAHWALAIIGASAGMAASVRQILLHINSDIGFGRTVFGLHMYTWSSIAFALTIIGCAFMLLIYPNVK